MSKKFKIQEYVKGRYRFSREMDKEHGEGFAMLGANENLITVMECVKGWADYGDVYAMFDKDDNQLTEWRVIK